MMKTAIKHKSRHFRRFLKANEAVSALEYALLVGVIAAGVVAAIVALEGKIGTAISKMGAEVNEAVNEVKGTN